MTLALRESAAFDGRILGWLCTAASLAMSLALAAWVAVHLPNAQLSIGTLWFVVRGGIEMMLYLLPVWAPDFAVRIAPSVSKWLRLICGAVGMGIGIALIVGLAAARFNAGFLIAVALMYLALGAYNCWFSSQRLRFAS